MSPYCAKSSIPGARGTTSGGNGTRISWDKAVHRESLMFKIRSFRGPPRPASTTPMSSTKRCNGGVRRW
ncbi:hypothetical protein GCM10009730_55320 [Streptomyces albidochromogenes]